MISSQEQDKANEKQIESHIKINWSGQPKVKPMCRRIG